MMPFTSIVLRFRQFRGRMARQARRYKIYGVSSSLFASSKSPRRVRRAIWRGLREWCGDAAYERYLRSAATRASCLKALSPEEFYVEQLNRRYSRPNHCC